MFGHVEGEFPWTRDTGDLGRNVTRQARKIPWILSVPTSSEFTTTADSEKSTARPRI
jgi:hypothetical protein